MIQTGCMNRAGEQPTCGIGTSQLCLGEPCQCPDSSAVDLRGLLGSQKRWSVSSAVMHQELYLSWMHISGSAFAFPFL